MQEKSVRPASQADNGLYDIESIGNVKSFKKIRLRAFQMVDMTHTFGSKSSWFEPQV
jgi:hypothetical protein